jgi:hypothetical protein
MANRLYNKQVSPKGYKDGGRVKKMGGGMMKRPKMQDGGVKKMGGGISKLNPGLQAFMKKKMKKKM